MGWLENHLNDFVKPRLGFTPAPSHPFSQEELTVIKNIWRSAKQSADGREILLAGRDTYIFEILARRENFPTTFRPDISRKTVAFIKEDYRDFYLLDTGFMGTIPAALGIQHFNLASASLSKANKQSFPKLRYSRSLALKIEGTPKYWKTAYQIDGVIHQEPAEIDVFERAAALTIAIYKNSAPRFIDRRAPLSGSWLDKMGELDAI